MIISARSSVRLAMASTSARPSVWACRDSTRSATTTGTVVITAAAPITFSQTRIRTADSLRGFATSAAVWSDAA